MCSFFIGKSCVIYGSVIGVILRSWSLASRALYALACKYILLAPFFINADSSGRSWEFVLQLTVGKPLWLVAADLLLQTLLRAFLGILRQHTGYFEYLGNVILKGLCLRVARILDLESFLFGSHNLKTTSARQGLLRWVPGRNMHRYSREQLLDMYSRPVTPLDLATNNTNPSNDRAESDFVIVRMPEWGFWPRMAVFGLFGMGLIVGVLLGGVFVPMCVGRAFLSMPFLPAALVQSYKHEAFTLTLGWVFCLTATWAVSQAYSMVFSMGRPDSGALLRLAQNFLKLIVLLCFALGVWPVVCGWCGLSLIMPWLYSHASMAQASALLNNINNGIGRDENHAPLINDILLHWTNDLEAKTVMMPMVNMWMLGKSIMYMLYTGFYIPTWLMPHSTASAFRTCLVRIKQRGIFTTLFRDYAFADLMRSVVLPVTFALMAHALMPQLIALLLYPFFLMMPERKDIINASSSGIAAEAALRGDLVKYLMWAPTVWFACLIGFHKVKWLVWRSQQALRDRLFFEAILPQHAINSP